MTQAPYQDYDKFYQQRNPADSARLQRSFRAWRRQFGNVLAGGRDRSILDLGCGDGRFVAFLKQEGFNDVTGVDLTPGLIETARQQVPAEFHCGEAQEFLNTKKEHYDIIFLLNLIEHIERDKLVDFMSAVQRALKPGGFAVVRCPNMNCILAAGHLADDLTHRTGLTEQSLGQLAALAGFSRMELLNQWRMQTFKGKIKAVLSAYNHYYLWWLRGGTKPKVFYRNLYARLINRPFQNKHNH